MQTQTQRLIANEQKLTAALAQLYAQLIAGREFPDASASVAVSCNVNIVDLIDAYDEHQAAFASRHPLA